MSMFKWDVVDPAPGSPWPRPTAALGQTVGIGAQHVVAMFGATFVFPLVMGLDPNLAIMFSGICTILFLLITSNKVPSYLGTSASFVGGVAAIRAQGGDSADVTGAIMVAGLVLLLVGVLVHFAGSGLIHKVLPPAVTGAVVMLIGFNLAPVVAEHLLAPGPVGRAAHRDVHGPARRCCCQASGPGSPSCSPWSSATCISWLVRPHLRPDQLGARRGNGGDRARPGQLGAASRRPTGSASRAARWPTASTWCTGRASR